MDNQVPADNEKSSSIQNDSTGKNHQSLAEIWENIITIGLGEQALRIGSILISLVLILMVVWVITQGGYNPQTAGRCDRLPHHGRAPQYTDPVVVTSIALAMFNCRPSRLIAEYVHCSVSLTLWFIRDLLWATKTLPSRTGTPGQVEFFAQDGPE